MKYALIALFSLATVGTTQAHATILPTKASPDQLKAALQAAPGCQNFVRADDQFMYLGFGPYLLGDKQPRKHIPGTVNVISLAHPDQQVTLNTFDSAIDAMTVGGQLYILSYDAIEEWDRTAWTRVNVYPSSTIRVPLKYRQHATGFALYNNQFIISHGRVGFSTWDIATRKPVGETTLVMNQSLPLESQARAVAINGNIAIFTIDSFTLVDTNSQGNQKPAFSGLVAYDLSAHKEVSRVAGVPEGAEGIYLEGTKIFINFGNATWILNQSSLQASSVSKPAQMIDQWASVAGHPIGKPLYDSENLYTCFDKMPVAAANVFSQVPEVLSRASLKM